MKANTCQNIMSMLAKVMIINHIRVIWGEMIIGMLKEDLNTMRVLLVMIIMIKKIKTSWTI